MVMVKRKATSIICDDIFYSLAGKMTISGMYTGDIVIPASEFIVSQLVFLFLMECAVEDPFKSLTLEVCLPGATPLRMEVPVATPPIMLEGRTQIIARLPFLLSGPILRPGRIDTKVIHEKGEIPTGSNWIVAASPPTASPIAS
jgi:hypothetical protein